MEWKRGSGFYVRPRASDKKTFDPDLDLDGLIAAFLNVARSRGHSPAEIQSRMIRLLRLATPDRVVVIEPEPELREILVAEIAGQVSARVAGSSLEDCRQSENLSGAFCVALYDHSEEVRSALPANTPCLFLRSRSAPQSMAGKPKPRPGYVHHGRIAVARFFEVGAHSSGGGRHRCESDRTARRAAERAGSAG